VRRRGRRGRDCRQSAGPRSWRHPAGL